MESSCTPVHDTVFLLLKQEITKVFKIGTVQDQEAGETGKVDVVPVIFHVSSKLKLCDEQEGERKAFFLGHLPITLCRIDIAKIYMGSVPLAYSVHK